MGELFNKDDFLWKLVARDLDRFLSGEEREMCAANVGRAIGFGLSSEIGPIKQCWAEAQRVKAEEMKQKADA